MWTRQGVQDRGSRPQGAVTSSAMVPGCRQKSTSYGWALQRLGHLRTSCTRESAGVASSRNVVVVFTPAAQQLLGSSDQSLPHSYGVAAPTRSAHTRPPSLPRSSSLGQAHGQHHAQAQEAHNVLPVGDQRGQPGGGRQRGQVVTQDDLRRGSGSVAVLVGNGKNGGVHCSYRVTFI